MDRTPNPVQIRLPNEKVEVEIEELMTDYYFQIVKFDPKKIEYYRNCFMNMNMSDKNSC